ncbi:hypothetical protein Dimus_004835 [Dionaea muscipula]
MESGRWISSAASIWIQSTAGGTYAFSIYSSALKSTQDYDQATLDTVSVFKDIGANVGVLSGVLYAAAISAARMPSRQSPTRWANFAVSGGPWVVHAVGAAQCFFGYFMMWLSVVGVIHRPPLAVMCLFMLLAAHSQTFFNTANVVTAVHNFPEYSGTIVGIMKGFLGLSGAILIQVYQALLKGNPSTFILMLALLPSLVSLLLMCIVRIYHVRTSEDKKYLNGFSVVALAVAGYLMIIIILENIYTFPSVACITTLTILLILLSSTLKIAFRAQAKDSPDNVGEYHKISNDPPLQQDTITNTNTIPASEGLTMAGDESKNIVEAMRSLDFWFLFIAMACGMGSGLATINNMSQIAESLGYDTVEKNTLVSLWSIWNFLGRLGAGYASDVFLHQMGWARPTFMVVTLAAMAAGHVVIASGFPGNLYLGTVLVGVCYGSQWSLMPTITSEIFGVQHMGTIFNTIAIASPVGSFFLSVQVVGYIYDKVAGEDEDSCSGSRCFMLSFFILACVCLVGSGAALMLFFRTRSFYRSIVLRRLQHSRIP